MSFVLTKGTDDEYATEFAYVASAYACVASKTQALAIGLKDSRQFFNQGEAKPKPIAPCTRDSSRALSELQVIAGNCDWLIALCAPVVIGRSIALVFRQSFENRSICIYY